MKIGYHLRGSILGFWHHQFCHWSYVSEVRDCFSKLFLMIGTYSITVCLFQLSWNCILAKSEIFLTNLTTSSSKKAFLITYEPLTKGQGIFEMLSTLKFFCKWSMELSQYFLQKCWSCWRFENLTLIILFMQLIESHNRKLKTAFVKWELPSAKVFIYIGMLLFQTHKLKEVNCQPSWIIIMF